MATSSSWFKKSRSLDSDEEPDRSCFFTHKELKKATDNFKKKLGDGGYGDVYEGKHPDVQTVIVRKFDRRFELDDHAVNVLSRYRHQNLVTFDGGCTNPKGTERLLVYEFVSNASLWYHFHCGVGHALTWDARIQIAIQTAEALGYLNSLHVIHGNVNSYRILVDDVLHVKVAGWDEYSISQQPNVKHGTLGYQDPEYNRTLRLSDKSDVYSFGVVLMELISGKKAIDAGRGGDDIFLDHMALGKMRNNKLDELVDQNLGYRSDDVVTRMIDSVAEVACKCLEEASSDRPPMAEILKILKEIKDGTQMA